eukprot:6655249-Prymnesium_polylepis.1
MRSCDQKNSWYVAFNPKSRRGDDQLEGKHHEGEEDEEQIDARDIAQAIAIAYSDGFLTRFDQKNTRVQQNQRQRDRHHHDAILCPFDWLQGEMKREEANADKQSNKDTSLL